MGKKEKIRCADENKEKTPTSLNNENDIIERYQKVLNNIGIETKVIERHRGKKSNYKD